MKRILYVLCMLFVFSAQVRAESTNVESDEMNTDKYDYDQRVRDLYAWLSLDNLSDESEYEQITFIYHWFMDALVGVTIFNNPSLEDKNGRAIQNARLKASIISLADQYYRYENNLHHRRFVTDIYATNVTDQDFYSVAEIMLNQGFYSEVLDEPIEPQPESSEYITFCEGPLYFIEARVSQQQNLIARGGCGEGMAADLDYADTLLQLAKNTIPQIRTDLEEVENTLRRN